MNAAPHAVVVACGRDGIDRGGPAIGRALRAAALAALAAVACATTVEPRVSIARIARFEREPAVFVSSTLPEAPVAAALRAAGIAVAPGLSDADVILRARFGNVRTRGRCGELRTIAFDLRDDEGRIAAVKALGWIAREPLCPDEHVLLDMASELAPILE